MIRDGIQGQQGPAAQAAGLIAIPAASTSSLNLSLLGGLLLLICP
jgi:hypothetical protein